ncbi:MAG TPA: flavin-nucleotide-binding protein [Janthinobacterium sp.]|nr:flavin-nucleotide-binding protein [Janthinobacterium sp.]
MTFPPLRAWPHAASPFHADSLRIQERLGVAERLDTLGRRGVGAGLTEQHQAFFPQLPFVVAASLDPRGQPWATLLFGEPGFVRADTAARLLVDAAPLPGDPLAASLVVGATVGLLGIEPDQRRRNRVNGHIDAASDYGFSVRVDQAYGNCPKYIQRRAPRTAAVAVDTRAAIHLERLDASARRAITAADTLFIASAHPGAVDASHRGGKPGFVRVDADGTLTLPDFAGNSHFRTIGNLVGEPRAGLLFPDFASGDLLYLAVDVELVWDGEELRSFAGAQRLLRCHVRAAVRLGAAMPLRYDDAADASPFLAVTGDWPAPA